MIASIGQIRVLQPTDDFSRISELVQFMLFRFDQEKRIRCTPKGKHLKREFFGEGDQFLDHTTAFVSVKDDQIIAMAGVQLSPQSNNGLLIAGVENGFDDELNALIDRCAEFVREHGGSRIGRFVSLQPGQIRNEHITFWERFGFQADPFFHTLIKCEVDEWTVPENLNTDGIGPANPSEIPDIAEILMEDKEEYLADEFRERHPTFTPDHVVLTMRQDDDITGIAYYRVKRFKDKRRDGKTYDGFGAWSTGIHFRPKYELPRQEKRRFIQAVLSSMKQLDIIFASGRVSSRDFDKFIEMFAEGFYFQGDPPNIVQNRMCRKV